jgi:hypothetical protein
VLLALLPRQRQSSCGTFCKRTGSASARKSGGSPRARFPEPASLTIDPGAKGNVLALLDNQEGGLKMDDQYRILRDELEHQKQLNRDLFSGVINLVWLVLDLLDRERILSREQTIAMLQQTLNELGHEHGQAPDALPIRHLIRALSGPRDDAPRRGWRPVTLPGGKDPSGPQDPHGGQ